MTTKRVIERRKSERLQVYLNANWEGALGYGAGTIGNISKNGCYIMTGGSVKEKELIRIEIQIPPEKNVLIWGEVTNYFPDIGFGLRFTGIGDEEQAMIAQLFDYIRRTHSSGGTKAGDQRTAA
jgi:hypothetical protein